MKTYNSQGEGVKMASGLSKSRENTPKAGGPQKVKGGIGSEGSGFVKEGGAQHIPRSASPKKADKHPRPGGGQGPLKH